MRRHPLAAFVVPSGIAACWFGLALVWVLQPAAWPALMVAVWSLVGVVIVVSMNPNWQIFGPALVRAPDAGGQVALTFDDGPDPAHTREVLDQLDAADARATFFVVGRAVRAAPELTREILERGHQVGHHSETHRWQLVFSPPRMLADFRAGLASIAEVTGRIPRFFRPPVGIATPEVLELAWLGFRFAGWSVRPFDGRPGRSAEVRRRVSSKIRAGDVVLLHDTARRGGGPPPALGALPGILEDLRARGLRSVTLAELTGEPAYLEESPLQDSYRRLSRIPMLVACTVVAAMICSAACAFGAEAIPSALPDSLVTAAAELNEATTVQARFEQTRISILFAEPVVQTGSLLLRRSDGRLLWLYDGGPAVLMADGRFYPAGATAEEAGDQAGGFGMPGGGELVTLFEAMFTLDVAVLARFFSGRDLGEGRFELKPTTEASAALFVAVVLQVGGSPLALQRVEMSEATGDSTVVAFTEVKIDAPLDEDRFRTPAERSAGGEGKAP
jgi:peptidoglycan-N-acetylglucosamine deacetylase